MLNAARNKPESTGGAQQSGRRLQCACGAAKGDAAIAAAQAQLDAVAEAHPGHDRGRDSQEVEALAAIAANGGRQMFQPAS